MPFYEYECPHCSYAFAKLMKVGAPPPPCPECKGEPKKKISRGSFALKGSGWYRDGYGGEG